jgi:hypothetical protein
MYQRTPLCAGLPILRFLTVLFIYFQARTICRVHGAVIVYNRYLRAASLTRM